MEVDLTVPVRKRVRVRAISLRMRRAELVIEGGEHHAEIVLAMQPKGYDSKKRAEGVALLSAAREVLGRTQLGRAAQLASTDASHQRESVGRALYRELAADSRAIFPPGSPERAALGLVGREPRSMAAFLRAADALFDGALSGPQELRDALAEIGHTPEKLSKGRAAIDALKDAENAQEGARASAQDLTPEQARALDALDTYVARYRKLARTALKERPQLLEAIGIKK